ncbi:MAG: IclR family transcriptional regulator [Cyclobacteriaceae bacterium]
MKIKKEENASRYSVPNLERALKIFELLAEHREGLITAEIVRKLGYPKNSVFRICNTLINQGYLRYVPNSQKIIISRKLFTVGYTAISDQNIVQIARDVMCDLRDEFKETVVLGALMETEGVVLEEIAGIHHFNFRVERGAKFYMHCTAPGKAIMAHLTEKEQNKIFRSIDMIRFNENTITDVSQLKKQLKKIKADRVAYDYEEQLEGCHCISAPIIDHYNHPVAAIWITGPASRLTLDQFEYCGQKLRAAADKVSEILGTKINNNHD